jgi:hypothetical protein
MTRSLQTVTLHVPAPQLPTLLTRLTTYLLHNHYAFLHTCHDATHADFDIFQQHHPLVRLTLRSTDAHGSTPMLASAPPPTLAAEAVGIIRHLLPAASSMADPVTHQE